MITAAGEVMDCPSTCRVLAAGCSTIVSTRSHPALPDRLGCVMGDAVAGQGDKTDGKSQRVAWLPRLFETGAVLGRRWASSPKTEKYHTCRCAVRGCGAIRRSRCENRDRRRSLWTVNSPAPPCVIRWGNDNCTVIT
jgi:hypothetical protein